MRAALSAILVSLCGQGCAASGDVAAADGLGPSSEVLLIRYSSFKRALDWALYEHGCDRGLKQDRARFQALYRHRINSVERFYRKVFAADRLEQVLSRDEIMVGGCGISRNGKRIMPHQAAFDQELRSTENVIRRSRGSR